MHWHKQRCFPVFLGCKPGISFRWRLFHSSEDSAFATQIKTVHRFPAGRNCCSTNESVWTWIKFPLFPCNEGRWDILSFRSLSLLQQFSVASTIKILLPHSLSIRSDWDSPKSMPTISPMANSTRENIKAKPMQPSVTRALLWAQNSLVWFTRKCVLSWKPILKSMIWGAATGMEATRKAVRAMDVVSEMKHHGCTLHSFIHPNSPCCTQDLLLKASWFQTDLPHPANPAAMLHNLQNKCFLFSALEQAPLSRGSVSAAKMRESGWHPDVPSYAPYTATPQSAEQLFHLSDFAFYLYSCMVFIRINSRKIH